MCLKGSSGFSVHYTWFSFMDSTAGLYPAGIAQPVPRKRGGWEENGPFLALRCTAGSHPGLVPSCFPGSQPCAARHPDACLFMLGVGSPPAHPPAGPEKTLLTGPRSVLPSSCCLSLPPSLLLHPEPPAQSPVQPSRWPEQKHTGDCPPVGDPSPALCLPAQNRLGGFLRGLLGTPHGKGQCPPRDGTSQATGAAAPPLQCADWSQADPKARGVPQTWSLMMTQRRVESLETCGSFVDE